MQLPFQVFGSQWNCLWKCCFNHNKYLLCYIALHYEIKDGFILFYKLIDSDIFDIISANRVVFGSSQNGSITATVDNPEGSILNIQSSTNLVDWNTFKTIQNEPSLEIIFPASKPSEFIRAIE